jgi:AcrR family transcriptional regulator
MPTVAKRGPGRPVDPGLTERRRAEILDAAARLFARDGFAGADIQVLADALQVGKGTIYRYFPSKRELFLAVADRVMRRLREDVDASIAGVDEPLERVATAIHTYLDFFAEHPQFVELLIQERANFKDRKKPTYFQHRDANIGRWQELFRGLIAGGRVRDMPVERITDVLSDLVYGTMFTNYFAGQRGRSSQQADEILDIVFHGILTDAERRRVGTEHPSWRPPECSARSAKRKTSQNGERS